MLRVIGFLHFVLQVVSTILDILLNVARVVLTREAVAIVPNLLPDVFQTMLVYRDTGAEIFSKCCALLQVMSVSPLVSSYGLSMVRLNILYIRLVTC